MNLNESARNEGRRLKCLEWSKKPNYESTSDQSISYRKQDFIKYFSKQKGTGNPFAYLFNYTNKYVCIVNIKNKIKC